MTAQLDGLEFVMSRTGMLDIFVMFWVLAGFGCLVVDRDQAGARLAERSQGLPSEGAVHAAGHPVVARGRDA